MLLHMKVDQSAVGSTNLCISCSLEINGKGVGGAADKEVCTGHTVNIFSHVKYFVACCLGSCFRNAFALHSICVCFTCTHKVVM